MDDSPIPIIKFNKNFKINSVFRFTLNVINETYDFEYEKSIVVWFVSKIFFFKIYIFL